MSKQLFQPDQPYYPKQKFTFRGRTYDIGQHVVIPDVTEEDLRALWTAGRIAFGMEIPSKFLAGPKGEKREVRDGGYFPPNAAKLTAQRRKKQRAEKLRAAALAAESDDDDNPIDMKAIDDSPPTSASNARATTGRGHRVPSKPREGDAERERTE